MNTTRFGYTISEEMQAWSKEHILGGYNKYGLEKMALILPESFVEQLSVEQVMDGFNAKFDVQLFSDTDLALNWLKN